MLSKRLYKKASFLLILVMIPALVLGYNAVNKEDSGMLSIALSCDDPTDPIAQDLIASISGSSNLIRFQVYDCADDAEYAVRSGRADAAWIFMDQMEQRIDAFVHSWSERDSLVRVIEREENVVCLIAREKLGGAVFGACARPFYLQYIRQNVPELDHVSEQTLIEYYNKVNMNGTLFKYGTVYGEIDPEHPENFLTTPVRGILAAVVVLASLATSMYYIRDERAGMFAWVREEMRPFVELGYQLISLVNVLVVVMGSLWLSGLTVDWTTELPVVIIFAFCCAAFAMLIRALFPTIQAVGALMPLLTVAMLAVCPVFFDLARLREIQFAMPPTYFVNGAYNPNYLYFGILYIAAVFVLYAAFRKLLKRN